MVSAMARREGPNQSEWPQLTTYRFSGPQEPAFAEVESLSLCCVLQGRKRVHLEGQQWHYDPGHYFVLTRGNRFTAEILDGTADRPFLSFVLRIDPAMVRRVAADAVERSGGSLRPQLGASGDPPAFVAEFNREITDALARFLRSVSTRPDRRLAPLYLQEIVFRLMQASQRNRLLQGTADETDSDPITIAVRYINENLSKGITVADIAKQVNMSPSTFAHLFRSLTGSSPYAFVTQTRLNRAKSLLRSRDVAIGEVAREVGYTSLPHFSTEFRRRFGVCPRSYAQAARIDDLDQDPKSN